MSTRQPDRARWCPTDVPKSSYLVTMPRFHRRAPFLLGLAACAPIAVLPAQSVPVHTLAKPSAELNEPFTSIASVRELGDGRVLVADNREKALVLANFAQQTVKRIGREGAGPGEYSSVGRLYPLANDVTLMYDFTNARYLVLQADGTPSALRRVDNGPFGEMANLMGFDAAGRVYLAIRPPGSREEGGVHTIVRYDASAKKGDTIATLTLPTGKQSGARMLGGGMIRTFTNMPFAGEDVAAIAADGRVAVVRVNDYHVEWFAPGKPRVSAPPVPYDAVRITTEEKHAFLRRQVRPGSFDVRSPAGGTAAPQASGAVPRVAESADALDDTGMQWPARKPPFMPGAASIDRDGRLWVLRTSTHDDNAPRYDVFDAAGRLTKRVVLPAKSALAGFGRGVVYVSRPDDDELRYLQRYALP